LLARGEISMTRTKFTKTLVSPLPHDWYICM
jgi:hypothetical protein